MDEIFKKIKTIAVVGLSDKPERPSYQVARYMQEKGFNIIPVNPRVDVVLGKKAYPDLAQIPDNVQVDMVNVFRKSEDVPPIAEEAVARKAKVLWMQEGVVSQEAAQIAEQAGLQVVMDKCVKKEYR
ncbi:hypothetical protein GGQ84_000923 [Desulfitispora alkaliphila]|uniref:CoA-binding protein n=1 Tax=Desulfitispora alkaliphila TaxID=622674 RepID=UPI003D25F489